MIGKVNSISFGKLKIAYDGSYGFLTDIMQKNFETKIAVAQGLEYLDRLSGKDKVCIALDPEGNGCYDIKLYDKDGIFITYNHISKTDTSDNIADKFQKLNSDMVKVLYHFDADKRHLIKYRTAEKILKQYM